MKILGLDISSTSTGYCIISDGKLLKSAKALGTIMPNSKDILEDKLVYFRDCISDLLNRYSPDLVAIENVYIGQKKVAVMLSRFSGVALEVCRRHGCNIILLESSKARSTLGLKNKKEEAFNFVVDKYGFSQWNFEKHNDITDSIVVALAARKISNGTAGSGTRELKKSKGINKK